MACLEAAVNRFIQVGACLPARTQRAVKLITVRSLYRCYRSSQQKPKLHWMSARKELCDFALDVHSRLYTALAMYVPVASWLLAWPLN